MKLPLEKMLRKKAQVDVGYLQDEIIQIIYNILPNAVLHSGTVIWRCYDGNRFSEDLDFYANQDTIDEREFFKAFESRNLKVDEFKRTNNLLFAKISDGNVEIRIEINFAIKQEGNIVKYEKMDGSHIPIYALTIDKLLLEKAAAYAERRFIRDIYDVFVLNTKVEMTNQL